MQEWPEIEEFRIVPLTLFCVSVIDPLITLCVWTYIGSFAQPTPTLKKQSLLGYPDEEPNYEIVDEHVNDDFDMPQSRNEPEE